MSSRTHINVSEMRQYAAKLREKADELRGQTQAICSDFCELTKSGAWDDTKSRKFAVPFSDGTDVILKLANRCDEYVAWLEKLANDVEENYGEEMDVS